jgi:uncharacterized protein
MELQTRRAASINGIDRAQWNGLAGGSPFMSHEFLLALERSGCVGSGTAWQPQHLLAFAPDGRLLGALPLYIKYDSRGEFVFDWSWADACERAGRAYFPKLVAAIPFTPATGSRLLVAPGANAEAVRQCLVAGALELATELDASSMHVLFPPDGERAWLAGHGFLSRKSCQFHWHNPGYQSFDDFLATFSSAKRKKARRERRRVEESGIRFEQLAADEPSTSDWDAIFAFYSRTFMLRGRPPYLNRAFFDEIARTMPQRLVVMLARFQGQPIAAALCFRSDTTLYGRYWGSLADFHSLHFEACYYQGIDYCIREGLRLFEPGTQGEHKISRGFTPTVTWSSHWLRDEDFRSAVADFVTREALHVDAYMAELHTHVPYRRDLPAGIAPAP